MRLREPCKIKEPRVTCLSTSKTLEKVRSRKIPLLGGVRVPDMFSKIGALLHERLGKKLKQRVGADDGRIVKPRRKEEVVVCLVRRDRGRKRKEEPR